MREYKFRCWDGDKMHYNVFPWQWDFVISGSWHRCEKSTGSGILGSGGRTGEFLVPGIRFTDLMQHIGLKDKNGKEIYDGDICDDGFGNLCKIEWQPDLCQFLAVFDVEASEQFQEIGDWCLVVGNIYQNSELLKPSQTNNAE